MRLFVYETLPIWCLAFIWILAWANAMQTRIRRELEPRRASSAMNMVSVDDHKPIIRLTFADADD